MSHDLSSRQWTIAAVMAEGLSQAAVAERLGISRSTLRTQLYGSHGYRGLYERVGAATDAQVVVWWYQCGQYQRPNWDARPDGGA
jgi:DNA-binding NarL/FixJ family response regulator